MSTADGTAARVRRPRMSPDRETELLRASLEVLREVGYDALTMDQVAARARCSKATLYRQWISKPQMIAAALYAVRPISAELVDTGSLRGDLLVLVQEMAVHAKKDTALISAVQHALLTDEDLATAIRVSLVEPEKANLLGVIDRAIGRGELPRSPEAAEFVPQMLFGAVVSRPLFDGAFADSDYLGRFIDRVVLPTLLSS